MRRIGSLIIGCLALATSVQAAQQNFDVKYRLSEYETDYRLTHRPQRQSYGFRMDIISDDNGVKTETTQDRHTSILASPNERYSIRLYNPLPVRVAVNLTVDGLNSITGKPSGVSDGSKWLIEPYSFITIPGWQVNDGESRRFFFTDKHASYAKWQGDRAGKDLAANCGVIGAAYFWNQSELDQYYDAHPIYRYSRADRLMKKSMSFNGCAPVPACQANLGACDSAAPAEEKAGTGMGERESHPTTEVDFKYDTGMYNPDQALVVYYEFAKKSLPNPFPALDYAPEMP